MDDFSITGWDIGGANIKAARINYNTVEDKIESIKSISRFFPMWDKREDPLPIIEEINLELGDSSFYGVTMTAELADRFESKIEGINYIINLFENNYNDKEIFYYSNNGAPAKKENIIDLEKIAAANWAVSALFVAEFLDDFILFDIGSTSTDIIPVINKEIAADGFTDIERLHSGELIYLGYLRSSLSYLVKNIPYQGKMIDVINEYFANTADLHLLKGIINKKEYTIPTPDNGEKTKIEAAARIARLISLDLNIANLKEIELAADYIYQKEIELIYEKLIQVYSRIDPELKLPLLANKGALKFAEDLKKKSSFDFIDLEDKISILKNNILSATAAAFLLINNKVV